MSCVFSFHHFAFGFCIFLEWVGPIINLGSLSAIILSKLKRLALSVLTTCAPDFLLFMPYLPFTSVFYSIMDFFVLMAFFSIY